MAVTKCAPTRSFDVANVAFLVAGLNVAAPSVVVPEVNVTVPPTDPPNAGVTVAVNVTVWVEHGRVQR